MAARRLVIVMLILLGVSLVAGIFAPRPVDDAEQDETTVTQPPPAPAEEEAGGRLVEERIDADSEQPRTISIQVGDQLALTVRTSDADEVAIPGIGELRFAAPLDPARFDLLATEEATYTVRLVEADRVIGRIEVEPRDSEDDGRGDSEAEDSPERLTGAASGNPNGESVTEEEE